MAKKTLLKLILLLLIICEAPLAPHIMALSRPGLTGRDLGKLEREYKRKAAKNPDKYLLAYADLLYLRRDNTQALNAYQLADSLGLSMTASQHRNFIHARHRAGLSVSGYSESGYFSEWPDITARMTPNCQNSVYEDFAPYLWNDILFVTSSRPLQEQSRIGKYIFTQLPFLHVFGFNKNCEEVTLDFLPSALHSKLHDGPLAISADTTLLIITRTNKRPNKKGIQTQYLAYYTRESGEWSEEKLFPFHDEDYYFQHPWFDDHSGRLYFASNMPGGMGGFDLYTIDWDGFSWWNHKNMGEGINSVYDEVFPSLSAEGDLVYSSNHLESTGGLDIVLYREGMRVLLPYPVNSVYDDFSLIFTTEYSGFFSSNREFEAFGDNIYFFELFEPAVYPFVVRIVDSQNQMPLEGVSISFFSIDPPLNGKVVTDSLGEAILFRSKEQPFSLALEFQKEGYYVRDIITDGFIFEKDKWLLTQSLETLPESAAVKEAILAGFFEVYFDNNQPGPRSWRSETNLSFDQTFDAYMQNRELYYQNTASDVNELAEFFIEARKATEQLAWLAEFLYREFAEGRHYVIIFTSHASPLGDDRYNELLSQRRFSSVENYLKTWNNGSLLPYMAAGRLSYENISYGSRLSPSSVSDDPGDLAHSIYSIEAARERRVTISWRRDADKDGGIDAKSILTSRHERNKQLQTEADQLPQNLYHIIVSSFNNLESTNQYVSELRARGFVNALILPRTPEGYYRVSLERYEHKEDADAALIAVRRNIQAGAWVLSP